MDPIIRAATVSPVARRIGRPAPVAASAPVSAHAGTAQPAVLQAARPVPATTTATEPPPAPAAAPAVMSAATPAPLSAAPAASFVFAVTPASVIDKRDYAAEMALAAAEHQTALRQRDQEIETLRQAAQQASLALTDTYTDAERRGYAAGEEKGAQAAAEALQGQIDRVEALVIQIGQARRALMENAEDAMVGIVFAALCRILGEEGAKRDVISAVVRDAIAATHEREQIVVRLHPDDAALLKDGAGDEAGAETRIAADASIKLGGCIIDGASGSLDARFETQLVLLAAALKQVRAARLAEQDAV